MSSSAPTPEQPALLRPKDGRLIAGVGAGLARWLETDAALVRGCFTVPVALGVLGLGARLMCADCCAVAAGWGGWLLPGLGALGLLAYALGLLFIPEE